MINKFGMSECEGKGLRYIVVAAIERGIPVIIAVPQGNLDAWCVFAGDMAHEIDVERAGR